LTSVKALIAVALLPSSRMAAAVVVRVHGRAGRDAPDCDLPGGAAGAEGDIAAGRHAGHDQVADVPNDTDPVGADAERLPNLRIDSVFLPTAPMLPVGAVRSAVAAVTIRGVVAVVHDGPPAVAFSVTVPGGADGPHSDVAGGARHRDAVAIARGGDVRQRQTVRLADKDGAVGRRRPTDW